MRSFDDMCSDLLQLFADIKEEVRHRDTRLYEQWKAGGFLIDNSVVSMYPSLEQIAGAFEDDDDYDNENEEDE